VAIAYFLEGGRIAGIRLYFLFIIQSCGTCLTANLQIIYFCYILCSIHCRFSKPVYLFQLLKERKALQEKSLSGGTIDRVSLKFEEIDRSAFEVVLKHMYSGDVIVPEHCNLDDVTNLAER